MPEARNSPRCPFLDLEIPHVFKPYSALVVRAGLCFCLEASFCWHCDLWPSVRTPRLGIKVLVTETIHSCSGITASHAHWHLSAQPERLKAVLRAMGFRVPVYYRGKDRWQETRIFRPIADSAARESTRPQILTLIEVAARQRPGVEGRVTRIEIRRFLWDVIRHASG
jgi:hypothetical protein